MERRERRGEGVEHCTRKARGRSQSPVEGHCLPVIGVIAKHV
jgi:hypothetical protein